MEVLTPGAPAISYLIAACETGASRADVRPQLSLVVVTCGRAAAARRADAISETTTLR